jgi:hypothetical protein
MATIAIPLTPIAANASLTSAARAIPGGITKASISINRNVGANPLDGAIGSQLTIWQDFSFDGGVTWNPELTTPHWSTSTAPGGIVMVPVKPSGTVQIEILMEEITIPPGATHVRAGIDNGPLPVTVSGTLGTS